MSENYAMHLSYLDLHIFLKGNIHVSMNHRDYKCDGVNQIGADAPVASHTQYFTLQNHFGNEGILFKQVGDHVVVQFIDEEYNLINIFENAFILENEGREYMIRKMY